MPRLHLGPIARLTRSRLGLFLGLAHLCAPHPGSAPAPTRWACLPVRSARASIRSGPGALASIAAGATIGGGYLRSSQHKATVRSSVRTPWVVSCTTSATRTHLEPSRVVPNAGGFDRRSGACDCAWSSPISPWLRLARRKHRRRLASAASPVDNRRARRQHRPQAPPPAAPRGPRLTHRSRLAVPARSRGVRAPRRSL